ncbi:MAG: ATP-dependent sacrificial sulfur transferase LarE [Deltaproteobacteria bacterium]|nr:ATP-dependent sacrificial sulfur transferase LarE [Deltaproteobacteria bacterium]
MDENAARQKKERLVNLIQDLNSVLVAFSGGVDSTFLLALSHKELGDKVIAATADSPAYPPWEREEAVRFTKKEGIHHIIFKSDETAISEFAANQPDRCYYCKKSLSRTLKQLAHDKGIRHVVFAANTDDLNDYRPGMKAATEMGILSPLIDVQLTKEEIRFLSKEMGLSTWDKPAMACLASRIPYGTPITLEKLQMVTMAEAFLANEGFRQYRVRHHGSVARIEVEQLEWKRFTDTNLRDRITERFREIGFTHIALDLDGYVSGSLNRVLNKENYYGS